jgi:hypothetical protein
MRFCREEIERSLAPAVPVLLRLKHITERNGLILALARCFVEGFLGQYPSPAVTVHLLDPPRAGISCARSQSHNL